MSSEELRQQRDLAFEKLNRISDRLKKNIENKQSRLITKNLSELKNLFGEFEERHVAYLVKAKKDLSDSDNMEVFSAAETIVSDMDDFAMMALQDMEEDEQRSHLRDVEQQKLRDNAKTKSRLHMECGSETDEITSLLSSLSARLLDADADLTCVAGSQELEYLEGRHEKTMEKYARLLEMEDDDERWREMNALKAEKEKSYRKRILEVRNVLYKNNGIVQPSAEGIGYRPSGSDMGVSEGSGLVRPRRMDYPKFDGKLRNYSTFKRDFEEIVVKNGNYTPEQLSHILRNHCLTGKLQSEVKNIHDYRKLWGKLDEDCHDEEEVVEEITRELHELRPIREFDYAGFIQLVDLVEQADCDLNALKATSVLNNKMTLRVLEKRCPDWVIKPWITSRENPGVPATDRLRDFTCFLKFLCEKRREAKKLMRLQDNRKEQFSSQSQNQKTKKATVLASAGDVVEENERKHEKKKFKCIVTGCTYQQKHFLSDCRAWKKLGAAGRTQVVLTNQLCNLCFGKNHIASDCPKKAAGWRACDIDGCGQWHSRLLHVTRATDTVLTVGSQVTTETKGRVLLLAQRITVKNCGTCMMMWDTGSTTSIVTFKYANRAGLEGKDCTLDLAGVGGEQRKVQTKLFVIPVVDVSGNVHKICAFGLENITSYVQDLDMNEAVSRFPGLHMEDVDAVEGVVDLLIGMNHAALMPVQYKTSDNLVLYKSAFGSGYVIGGVTPGSGLTQDYFPENVYHLAHAVNKNMKMTDFLTAEAFGVDLPRRCRNCLHCKDCSYKSSHLSWLENKELAEIEKGLTLDVDKKQWTATYPFKADPSIMQNNYFQAKACMERLEKRLKKSGHFAEFQEQFNDARSRGVFKLLTSSEIEEYEGPVNYITLVEAYKSGPHVTTPVRLCLNSSMKFKGVSLNDLLMKGPSALNDLYGVCLGFRKHKVGFVKDLSKFYQSVLAKERDQHVRRILWRDGNQGCEPQIYITTTVNFGDKPAGCIAQTAVRETAALYREIDPVAADFIIKNTFCDDTPAGADTRKEAEDISQNMDKIVAQGGFKYKSMVVSGDEDGPEPQRILGMGWYTKNDEFFIDAKINVSPKRKGVRTEENVDLFNTESLAGQVITKRIVWRVSLGQYDPLGLASVFLVRLKLIMRSLSGESGRALEWDEPVPEQARAEFLKTLSRLKDLKNIRFPRCVVPPDVMDGQGPELICFADGSKQAFCALVYLRWKVSGGHYKCAMLTGKTRVAPLKGLSIPRVELLGAVTAVRLAAKVGEYSGFDIAKRYFITDSSAVLGMIKNDNLVLKEFVGARIHEIKSKSDPETEWMWVDSKNNVADMGTRATVEPEEMKKGSAYQQGLPWMEMDEEFWPVKRSPGTVPNEEIKQAVHVMISTDTSDLDKMCSRLNSFDKLIRVFAYSILFIKKIRSGLNSKDDNGDTTVVSNIQSACKNVILPHDCTERACQLIFKKSQESLREDFQKGKYASLLAAKGEADLIVTTGGRLRGKMQVGYGKGELAILPYDCPVSRLIMQKSHNIDHASIDRSVLRSRNIAWIIRARTLAKKVRNNCFKCKLLARKLHQQIMAPLPESRLPPAPVFDSTAVDLFGPIWICDTVKKRVKKKCWGVLFCCTVTSAIHLEISEDYSCDSFLLCLRRFVNLRGTPSRFQSDPGDQLLAAAVEIGKWDFSCIVEWSKARSIEWHKIPVNSQHYNGMAEAMIRVTKRQMTLLVSDRCLTKGELDTVMSDVAYIVNSRPLMLKDNSDPWADTAVTPLHLLGGRATHGVPIPRFDGKASLTKRLQYMETLKMQFWKNWYDQVFPNLIPSYKWRTKHRNLKKGDVVLIKGSNPLKVEYRLGLIVRADPGTDGFVRRVTVKYKNVDCESRLKNLKFHETERSVQNVIVIVPIDWKPEEVEAEVMKGLEARNYV